MLTVEECMSLTLTCCDAVRLEGAQRLTFLPDLFGGDFSIHNICYIFDTFDEGEL